MFDKIINTAIAYQIQFVDEKTIDDINILNATKKGMAFCINNLSITPDVVLVDAVKGFAEKKSGYDKLPDEALAAVQKLVDSLN